MGKCVRTWKRDAAQVRLICIPPAGLGASFFHRWHLISSSRMEICAVQLPGREDRILDPPHSDMASLLGELKEALEPLLQGPYALFGHSFGAYVAYELAHDLQQSGLVIPVHLFVSAGRAPHLPPRLAPISQLEDSVFLTLVQQRYDAIPKKLLNDAEMARLIVRTLKADFRILETRKTSSKALLSCPVTAFGGESDPMVRQSELEEWRHQTRESFRFEMFPGGHFFPRSVPQQLLSRMEALVPALFA